jgi:O-acetyl-ADP-ribose deacetylase (regulator of RNase III)
MSGGLAVVLAVGDITKIPVDIIVNSANRSLMRGSGVCGAIHKAAGRELEKECLEIKERLGLAFLPIGEIIVTKAYNLPAKYVIHTVGAKNNGLEDISLIKNCYINSLMKAEDLKASSISFPPISTGIHGLPMVKSAEMVKEVLDSLPNFNYLKKIIFVLKSPEDQEIYSRILSSRNS